MATSQSTNFTNTKNEIIADAYSILNVYGADEVVSAEDSALASRILNRMTKAWQATGVHLWKKETAIVFLQKDQIEYSLKSTSTDHATLSYVETTLSADEAIAQTTLSVTSSSGMTAADYIGIENEDGELQWSTINNVPDSTSVVIDDPLTTACESSAVVYAYTTKLDEPFNIYSAVRESSGAIDTPMNYLSYEAYFQLPNKTSSSTPVSYSYDRQLGDGIIRVWPAPDDVEYIMKINISAKVQDFDSAANTPDFPQEWYEALILNLAMKLAPAFGKTTAAQYQFLKQQADNALMEASSFDNEQGSLYFQPDHTGMNYGYGR